MNWLDRMYEAYGVLFLLVFSTFVIGSLLPSDENWPTAFVAFLVATTASVALISSRARTQVLAAGLGLAVASVLLALAGAALDASGPIALAFIIQVGLILLSIGQVLHTIFASEEVGYRAILGAISVYGLFGLLFAGLFVMVDRLAGPFFTDATNAGDGAYLYFSFTTLTTTGYGDLLPASQPGRMLAGLEMIVGQIFLVTLVAGLVSLWRPGERLRRRRAERTE